MKILYFINKTNGFAKSMIFFMEEQFPEIEKSYYIVDRRSEEKLPDLDNVHRIYSYKEFVTNKRLIEDLKGADKIIVSGVFTMQYVLPIYGRKILKKVYWQFWGGDYENFRTNRLSLKLKMRKKIVLNCLKNAKGVVLLTAPENKAFEEIFGKVAKNKMHVAVVPGGQKDDELLLKIRNERSTEKSNKIVIGNSATESNQHLDIFEKIKHLDVSSVKLYCPLSYGDIHYRDKVIEKGKELFGNSFYPITEYMEYEEYIRFLNSCDVGIYNNNRQQALGNISLMLNLGKKVYVPKSIQTYYKQFGYKLYLTRDIKSEDIMHVLEFSSEDSNNNYKCYNIRKKRIYMEWSKILKE